MRWNIDLSLKKKIPELSIVNDYWQFEMMKLSNLSGELGCFWNGHFFTIGCWNDDRSGIQTLLSFLINCYLQVDMFQYKEWEMHLKDPTVTHPTLHSVSVRYRCCLHRVRVSNFPKKGCWKKNFKNITQWRTTCIFSLETRLLKTWLNEEQLGSSRWRIISFIEIMLKLYKSLVFLSGSHSNCQLFELKLPR